MKTVLLLLIALSSTFAQVTVTFTGNVSVTKAGTDWNYRQTSFRSLNIPGFLAAVSTEAYQIDINTGTATATSDGVFSVSYAGLLTAPTTWLGYFKEALAVNFTGINNPITISGNVSTGIIGEVIMAVEEVDANNVILSTQNLNGLVWSYSAVNSNTQVGQSINYGTFVGTQLIGNFNVSVTFIQSNVVGVIAVGGCTTFISSPKAIETIIQIQNYPYQNPAAPGTPRLKIGVGYGTANAQFSGTAQIQNTDASRVYFTAANTAVVDGQTKNVKTVMVTGNFNADLTGALTGVISGKYGAQVGAQLVYVNFGKNGAANVCYDPSLGAGAIPGSAITTSFSILLIVLAIIVELLF